tara:strand:+ start:4462 stop:4713 length:252 start_codon:yes stop_codon:yes gene_type:complete
MIKQYTIQGKGYFNYITKDTYLSNKEFTDIKCSCGCIEFKGTEKQLDSFLEKLYDDESTFKVIGVHEEDEELENYFKKLFNKL